MTAAEQRAAAKKFAEEWKGEHAEKQETHPFWGELLDSVFEVTNVHKYIEFEKPIKLESGNRGYIDAYIPETKVLIEQKGSNIDPRKPEHQSDGTVLTPYQQARRYENQLLRDEQPDWVIVCNFREFIIYNMRINKEKPVYEFTLDKMPEELDKLKFLVDPKQTDIIEELEISKQAGDLVSELYNALLEQYNDPDSPETLHTLNVLCVRLVFCFYAEDADIIPGKNAFGSFLKRYKSDPQLVRSMLMKAFDIFDTPYDERDPYEDKALLDLPYVNGGLFDKKLKIIPPAFNEKIVNIIVEKASLHTDWRKINPTIFGAVFESTLNPETRRSGGMHYTSIENIHKVIDPLFLDDLKAELEEIKSGKQANVRVAKLEAFREKLAGLKFLDPACGSGNFLTETYLSLRRLENEVLKILYGNQVVLDSGDIIKVSIGQFYGIEINDFACRVAQTALWIAEAQMMSETMDIVNVDLDFLPLKSYQNIIEGNALRVDWETVVPKNELNYIMGNPPFHGFTFMDKAQKQDMSVLFKDVKNLDYVCGWYKKASDYIVDTKIEVAFVSTNSITQGETVARFWDFMSNNIINFAHRTFVWDSEASDKAHVHCVIIGFARISRQHKLIFNNSLASEANNINPYLVDGPNVLVRSRNKPLCNIPKMIYGNKPADGGHLIIEDDEYNEFIKKSPNSKTMIRPLLGAAEYIKGKKRWCLWLVDVSPKDIKQCPAVAERVKKCKEAREASIAEGIRKFAATPTLFAQRTQPTDVDFIIVPRVSSQSRNYVPMGFIKSGTIVTDRVQIIPNATIYDFGIITSNIHMAWMRATCMRLKSDYSYSKDIVYNNFPWCKPTDEQKAKIEATAQAILDARAKYPDCSLADLYDETTMPPELRRAHKDNDNAVLAAYGFSKNITESEIVAELMKMYQELTNK